MRTALERANERPKRAVRDVRRGLRQPVEEPEDRRPRRRVVDDAVRSRSNSVGGLFEVGYDSASDDGEHAVDIAIDVSAAATRFGTEQSVIAPDPAARGIAPRSAALAQGRFGTTATVTILANTDLSLDAAYFVYDQTNPGDVGLFTAAAANGQTTGGTDGRLALARARIDSKPAPMEPPERSGRLTRRHFLTVVGGAATVFGCSSSGGASQASGTIAAGNVSTTAVGKLTFVPGAPLVLGRDASGLYAMTSICTHQDCDMRSSGSISAAGLACSCHGSAFTPTGAVASGPARSPLLHFEVKLAADGAIAIDADVVVDSAARTAVV